MRALQNRQESFQNIRVYASAWDQSSAEEGLPCQLQVDVKEGLRTHQISGSSVK